LREGARDAAARATARQTLARLDLDELADKLPEEISGGQAQRVAVARAGRREPVRPCPSPLEPGDSREPSTRVCGLPGRSRG
jgi:ABC-type thiamine transport system ATPase subunit